MEVDDNENTKALPNNQGTDGEEDDTMHSRQAWQRDPEKERDKILGFFNLSGEPIPRDIFHLIMSFIDPFPYCFMLRSVCSQWLYEFQEQVYDQVRYLSLVDDGCPKYYINHQQKLVQFKPIAATGRRFRLESLNHISWWTPSYLFKKEPIYRFFGEVFANITHLKLGWRSFLTSSCRHSCYQTFIPLLKQLETLEILGTKTTYRNIAVSWKERCLSKAEILLLVTVLPPSIKTLRFIGLGVPCPETLPYLNAFSMKGRQLVSASDNDFLNPKIVCDVQNLSMEYSFLEVIDGPTSFDWSQIKDRYTNFELSVVGVGIVPTVNSKFNVVSIADYIKHMSKKHGIMLAHMDNCAVQLRENTLEQFIETAVREYGYLKPLIDLYGTANQNIIHLKSQVIPKYNEIVCNDHSRTLKALELLTDPDRMKYPELTLDINHKFEFGDNQLRTIISILVSHCTTEDRLSILKSVIEKYNPDLAVDGTQNILLSAYLMNPCPVRPKLIQYLVKKKPELLSLGNYRGKIEKNRKQIPLIQLMLTEGKSAGSIEEFSCLVEEGVSLTTVDFYGQTILHAACQAADINCLSYFLSVCPENDFCAPDVSQQTPLERVLTARTLDIGKQRFLEAAFKLPYFSSRKPQEYKTSHGSLLHTAVAHNSYEVTSWLLNNGFEANQLNDRGESPIFHLRAASSYSKNRSFTFFDQGRVEKLLVESKAQIDIENIYGETAITHALHNTNYMFISYFIDNPSISSKQLYELLRPRMKYGLNALHYTCWFLSDDKLRSGCQAYSILKKCALLCLEHYPEMLYERSESHFSYYLLFGGIENVSPLQILLRAPKGEHLLKELGIDLAHIANKPVFTSNSPHIIATTPAIYAAYQETTNHAFFDTLLSLTDDLLVRDESTPTKPNLLHITAQRSFRKCEFVLKHWKQRYTSPEEISRLINLPLENDAEGGRKARNATLLCCSTKQFDTFAVLWPYTKPIADQFDNPVSVALQAGDDYFAMKAILQYRILPSKKEELLFLLRKWLTEYSFDVVHEKKFVTMMEESDETHPIPTWLELFTQTPLPTPSKETKVSQDSKEPKEPKDLESQHMTVLQLVVRAGSHALFDWIFKKYQDHDLLRQSLKAIEPVSGNTLLHYLAAATKLYHKEITSFFVSIISPFQRAVGGPKKRSKLAPANYELEQLTQFLNIQNKLGESFLHRVSSSPTQCLLRDLLILGADLELKNSNGKTPKELMTCNGPADIIRKFLHDQNKASAKRKREAAEKETETEQESTTKSNENEDESEILTPRRRRKRTKHQ